jgi:hypothetical protein
MEFKGFFVWVNCKLSTSGLGLEINSLITGEKTEKED